MPPIILNPYASKLSYAPFNRFAGYGATPGGGGGGSPAGSPQDGDPYWANVVSLMHFDGENGSDGSTSVLDYGSVSPSRNWLFQANAQIDTANTKFGAGSLLLDGSSDYIKSANSESEFAFAGDFTVEFWFYANSWGSPTTIILVNVSGGFSIACYSSASNGIEISRHLQATTLSTKYVPSLSTWHHLAVCRKGTNLWVFVDGVPVGSGATDSSSYAQGVLCIGGDPTFGRWFDGWIDDFRITKGVARYVGDTSPADFTPPTEAFPHYAQTAANTDNYFGDTKLLLHFNEYGSPDDETIVDYSHARWTSPANAVTRTGGPKIDGTTTKWGAGALNIDTNGAYISVPFTTENFGNWWLAFFCIEMWVYPVNFTNAADSNGRPVGIGYYAPTGTSYFNYGLGCTTGGAIRFSYWNGIAQQDLTGSTISTGTWTHLAMTHTPGEGIRLFVNGSQVLGPTAVTGTPLNTIGDPTPRLCIGTHNSATWTCYYDDVRITKGTATQGVARYRSTAISPSSDHSFTAPSAQYPDSGAYLDFGNPTSPTTESPTDQGGGPFSPDFTGGSPESLYTPKNMTNNTTPSPWVASASSEWSGGGGGVQAWNAFNNSTANNWLSDGTSTGWLKIDRGSGNAVTPQYYRLACNQNTGEGTRMPKDWTLQGSNDDASWDVLDTVTNETGWAKGEWRTFFCDSIGGSPSAYRYFKINVTANNGDTYLQIAEMEIWG